MVRHASMAIIQANAGNYELLIGREGQIFSTAAGPGNSVRFAPSAIPPVAGAAPLPVITLNILLTEIINMYDIFTINNLINNMINNIRPAAAGAAALIAIPAIGPIVAAVPLPAPPAPGVNIWDMPFNRASINAPNGYPAYGFPAVNSEFEFINRYILNNTFIESFIISYHTAFETFIAYRIDRRISEQISRNIAQRIHLGVAAGGIIAAVIPSLAGAGILPPDLNNIVNAAIESSNRAGGSAAAENRTIGSFPAGTLPNIINAASNQAKREVHLIRSGSQFRIYISRDGVTPDSINCWGIPKGSCRRNDLNTLGVAISEFNEEIGIDLKTIPALTATLTPSGAIPNNRGSSVDGGVDKPTTATPPLHPLDIPTNNNVDAVPGHANINLDTLYLCNTTARHVNSDIYYLYVTNVTMNTILTNPNLQNVAAIPAIANSFQYYNYVNSELFQIRLVRILPPYSPIPIDPVVLPVLAHAGDFNLISRAAIGRIYNGCVPAPVPVPVPAPAPVPAPVPAPAPVVGHARAVGTRVSRNIGGNNYEGTIIELRIIPNPDRSNTYGYKVKWDILPIHLYSVLLPPQNNTDATLILKGGNFKEKYLKYKAKYLELKSKI